MVACFTTFSQKQYFIYLQAEPEQVFFIKLNEKIHNSTSSGYLILSRLKDTVYNFTVGFPQNKWPEQKFSVDLKARDRGYLLKNFGEKGWGLVDLQSAAIQMGTTASSGSQRTEQREVSAFTDILSKAANDPSLKERPVTIPVVLKENKETAKNAEVNKTEEPVIQNTQPTLTVKREETPVVIKEEKEAVEEKKTIPVEEYKRSTVTRRSESSTSDGLGMTFIDDYGNGKKDTIIIFIPNQRPALAEIKEPEKETRQFLELSTADSVKKNDPPSKKKEKEVAVAASNANCSSLATESDFLKLQKKMVSVTNKKMATVANDEAMIDAAMKSLKVKCYSTSQIKNLSTLFLNDNGKYKFFDAAYTHVSDPDNFPSLQAELKDDYYVNRFKAMLR